MRRMIVKHDFDFPDQTVHKGTILDVEDEPAPNGLVFILSGDLKYRSVHIDHLDELDVVEIHQELLQRREEVRELMQTVERNTELIRQLQEDAAEVHRLRERNQSLLDQIEVMESECRPIALPLEVVTEIEAIKANCSKGGSHWKFKVLKNIFDGCAPNVSRRTGVDQLLRALVNGYTIEEPQTFQTGRKLDECEIRALRNWYKGALLRIEDGTDPDGFAKEAIEEVALYLGGAELLKDMSGFCKTQLEREKAAECG